MRRSTFEGIKRSAARRGARDPQAVAGAGEACELRCFFIACLDEFVKLPFDILPAGTLEYCEWPASW